MSTIVDNAKSGVERVHEQDIAVLVPCFNEELTVGRTVEAFREALPSATIYVYDNNSSDRTVDIARAAGAVVRHETRQGKGNVVRRMFADIDADIYVLVDGDAT
jgi:glycosyltransferase involved in cell wall biosynthesis